MVSFNIATGRGFDNEFSAIDTLEIPTAGIDPIQFVHKEIAQQVALWWANSLVGNVASGPVLPYVDFNGNTVAYMFNFAINSELFPPYSTVVQDWHEWLRSFSGLPEYRHQVRSENKYFQVLVSARYDRAPILMHSLSPSEYYTYGYKAKQRAYEYFGDDNIILSRIYFLFPDLKLLEFVKNDMSILIEIHGHGVYKDIHEVKKALKIEYNDTPELTDSAFVESWDILMKQKMIQRDTIIVNHYPEWAMFYDWSYGCAPTAAAMVLGFWDHHSGYGRLVGSYMQRRDCVQDEIDFHIPFVQFQLAIAMNTDTLDGGTLIDSMLPGITYVTNVMKEYSFFNDVELGNRTNDFAWETIVEELVDNHPIMHTYVWYPGPSGHATAVFGCCKTGVWKYVYRHNTWNSTPEWYIYWDGNPESRTWIHTIRPYGGENQNIFLKNPHGDVSYCYDGGGEQITAGLPYLITWDNGGNSNGTVQIMRSVDGGHTYQNVIASTPNTGQYQWEVPGDTISDSCRIYIKLNPSDLIAADGSYGNFSISKKGPSSMYRNNKYHWGRTGYIGPTSPALNWNFPTTSGVESTPAINNDGTIYVGSDDNQLYAINPDGSLKWSYGCGVYWFSSPAIDDSGIIYIGGSSRLYAINPDGTRKWHKSLGGTVLASPTIGSDGTIYACTGSNQGYLFALAPDSTILWSCQLDGLIYSSPAVTPGDSIIVATLNGKVCCVYNGHMEWEYNAGSEIYGAPLIQTWTWVESIPITSYVIWVASYDGNVHRITNNGSGQVVYTTQGHIYSSPALGWASVGEPSAIYVTAMDSCLHAFTSSEALWTYHAGSHTWCSPVVDDHGTIYFSCSDGNLYAVSPEGILEWQYQIGDSGHENWSSPTIGPDKTIYIGYPSHTNLLAIYEPPIGIDDTDQYDMRNMKINIYPCPANKYANLNIELPIQTDIPIAIYDIQGRLIKNFILEGESCKYLWNLEDNSGRPISNGIYFLTVNLDKYTMAKKIIIIR